MATTPKKINLAPYTFFGALLFFAFIVILVLSVAIEFARMNRIVHANAEIVDMRYNVQHLSRLLARMEALRLRFLATWDRAYFSELEECYREAFEILNRLHGRMSGQGFHDIMELETRRHDFSERDRRFETLVDELLRTRQIEKTQGEIVRTLLEKIGHSPQETQFPDEAAKHVSTDVLALRDSFQNLRLLQSDAISTGFQKGQAEHGKIHERIDEYCQSIAESVGKLKSQATEDSQITLFDELEVNVRTWADALLQCGKIRFVLFEDYEKTKREERELAVITEKLLENLSIRHEEVDRMHSHSRRTDFTVFVAGVALTSFFALMMFIIFTIMMNRSANKRLALAAGSIATANTPAANAYVANTHPRGTAPPPFPATLQRPASEEIPIQILGKLEEIVELLRKGQPETD